jgi:CTP synthase
MKTKYIFFTGGVVSSLGKGLTAAATALLLERHGLKTTLLKLDPYFNVDPGTMSPFQHGEVYVTDDGAETDLDLGHYYRFTNSPLSRYSNTTSGQVFDTVIKRERRGDYLGQTIQVIPHITNEIKDRILKCTQQTKHTDVVLVEIGGTVGDIESLPFLEAIRQFRNERPNDCINIHLTYIPYLKAAGEIKTKPTQHSVQSLRQIGIFPDIIICRSEMHITEEEKRKISLFCNVPKEAVVEEVDVENTIYEVPLQLHRENLDNMICRLINLSESKNIDLSDWKNLVDNMISAKKIITIAIVGKYVQHQDAYKSIFEALEHTAYNSRYRIKFHRISSDEIHSYDEIAELLQHCDGCLIPGGFGERGWHGKLYAAQYCRENNLPYFGICLGMQALIVEFARNVLKLKDADSTEISPQTPHPVISLLSEQQNVKDLGGTMRLGSYPCSLTKDSKAIEAYSQDTIHERHRHRYEFNNSYLEQFEKENITFSGTLKNGDLKEIAEIQNHPWMLGVQFHPEFKSKPTQPHPLFQAFIKAMVK